MTKRNRLQEEKEYADLMSVNEETQVNDAKKIINKLLPKDIKVVAKNESQKELIKSIKNNEITICAGPAGTGKAQPLDSLILSEKGFIKMSEVKLNDMIYTMSGELTKVIGVFPQGKKKTYEITFSDDSVTECCDEHLWLSKSARDRENKKDYKVRQLSEMINDFILVEKDGRKNYSIPITQPIKFKEKEISVDSYLMGVLIGDGCFTAPNVRLTSVDEEIINEFNKKLDKLYTLSQVKSDTISYNIIFSDKYNSKRRLDENYLSFKNIINIYGLNNHKSSEKFIPREYLFNSIDNRIKLLQGLMDSDGTVERKSGSLVFSTSSLKLIEDFRFLVESLGGVVNKLRIKRGKYKNNDDIIIVKNSYSYSFRLPNNIIPFKLKRKLEIYKPKIKYFPIRYIKDIKYIGEKESQCIMVDDLSHTYLTNNFIVTHNTFVAIAYALSLLRKNTNRYKKIYLVKSVTTLKNEELGYLKGGLREKIDPFMWSFYINIEKIILKQTLEELLNEDIIVPFPLAYLRGASLDDCIIIADEMQNVNLDNARTLLTRIGSNCKIILLGDKNQIDLKNKNESSLDTLLRIFENTENFGVISMSEEDTNVRNPLITIMEDKFKSHYELVGYNNGNGNGK